MPSITGGNQLSQDYAGWAWVGNHFVGRTKRKITHERVDYEIGKTSDEQVVCGMWDEQNFVMVAFQDIPKEVLSVLEGVSFDAEMQKVERVAEMIQSGGS